MNDTLHDTTASKQKLVQDLQRVITDAEELLRVTANQAGEKVGELRVRMQENLTSARHKLADAEAALIKFLAQYVPKGKAPLCGNSIGQDRRFMERYMPKLNDFFHYRNVDVSTLKELARRWKPDAYASFKKAQRHTALADVHESIDELAHYRARLLSV